MTAVPSCWLLVGLLSSCVFVPRPFVAVPRMVQTAQSLCMVDAHASITMRPRLFVPASTAARLGAPRTLRAACCALGNKRGGCDSQSHTSLVRKEKRTKRGPDSWQRAAFWFVFLSWLAAGPGS